MERPKMPPEPANINPQAWFDYWRDMDDYKHHTLAEDRRNYSREWQRRRTQQKQINKMIEFMNKYPTQALAHAETLRHDA